MVTARRFNIPKMAINKHDRCHHTMSRDLSARPHEISSLKIKDIVFKTADDKQYAEVLVNGKTGTRHTLIRGRCILY
ncbi:MAG: hypothetical protein WBZ20_13355 [Nitrososphaeraceae archaeon]